MFKLGYILTRSAKHIPARVQERIVSASKAPVRPIHKSSPLSRAFHPFCPAQTRNYRKSSLLFCDVVSPKTEELKIEPEASEVVEETQSVAGGSKPKRVTKEFLKRQPYHQMSDQDKAIFEDRKLRNRNMNNLKKQGNYLAAIEEYNAMIKAGIPPNLHTYSSIISIYADSGRISSAEKIWNTVIKIIEENKDKEVNMAGPPKEMDIGTINAMIHAYCKVQRLDKALEFYKDITEKWNLKPDPASILPILTLTASKLDVAATERLYFDFKINHPNQESLLIYTTLLDLYGAVGQFHNVGKILDEMKSKNIPLDPIFSSILMKHLMKADDEVASKLVEKLQEMGLLTTDLFSFLARDLTTIGDALTLLATMKANGSQPDINVFNTLMKKVCKTYSEAKEWLGKIEENGIKPNQFTFDNMLLIAGTPADHSKVKDIAEITADMTKRGLFPTEATYCILIRFYSQIHDRNHAEELVELCRKNNPNLGKQTLNAIVRMYAFSGAYDKLMKTMAEVQQAKIALPSTTIDIVFKSMMRHQKYLDCAAMLTNLIHTRQMVQIAHFLTLYERLLERAGCMPVYEDMTNPHVRAEWARKPHTREKRTPGQNAADRKIIFELHQTLIDTPGALAPAPAEYWVLVMASADNVAFLCKVASQAFRKSTIAAEGKSTIFVEFLKFLEKQTFQFADDIAAWKAKLEGAERNNPLTQSQFLAFVNYVLHQTNNPTTGSRVNKPTL